MRVATGARGALRAATFAAVILAPLTDRAAVAATAPVPALGEHTTITGTHTGWTRVTLSRPVNFQSEGGRELHRPSMRLTGGAVGWLLQADTTGVFSPFVSFLRMPKAEGGSVQYTIDGVDQKSGKRINEDNVLPAGRYRLFLVTDGAGSVRFRLPGVRGRAVTLSPSRRVAHRAVTYEVPLTAGVGPPAYANGVTVDSQSATLLLAYDWLRTKVQAAAHFADCLYHGRPPADRWLPGCPAGDNTITSVIGVSMGCCGTANGGAYFPPGSGTWSYGRWYDNVGVVEKGGMFFLWLPEQ